MELLMLMLNNKNNTIYKLWDIFNSNETGKHTIEAEKRCKFALHVHNTASCYKQK